VLHFVALNPKQTFPYLDHLEQAYNLEIEDKEASVLQNIKAYLETHYAGKVNYKFIKVEGEGETGPLIENYVALQVPDCDMVYVGTRNNGPLKRWALGSVSDYLVHHLGSPVCVVKDPSSTPGSSSPSA
jgi:nucleotide-binding universal stress UspA family protein